jgi:hypothetical protein
LWEKWQVWAGLVPAVLLTIGTIAYLYLKAEGNPPSIHRVEETYLDPETKLTWTRKDNGRDIDWNGGARYCDDLTLEGFTDWRLPTIDEIEKLYDPNDTVYKIRKPFELTACCHWSSTKRGIPEEGFPLSLDSAWYFNFNMAVGGRNHTHLSPSHGRRALCVRASGE